MLLIGIWLLLIVLGLLYKKSKKISYVQVFFAVLLMGLSKGTADYAVYERIFNKSITSQWNGYFTNDWLLLLMYRIVGFFGGNYQIALFICALAGMILLYKSVEYYTNKVSFVLSLYLLGAFVIDATQVKNFLAASVWLYFSRYLFKSFEAERTLCRNEIFQNLMKYLAGVFLASSIHASFVITIIFVLLFIKEINEKKLLIVTLVINIINIFMVSSAFESFVDRLMIGLSSTEVNAFVGLYTKYRAYKINFNRGAMEVRLYLTVFLLTYLVIILLLLKKSIVKRKLLLKEGSIGKVLIVIDYVYMLNLFVGCLTPLFNFSMEFYRFQRMLLPLDFVAIAYCMKSSNKKMIINLTDFKIVLMGLMPAVFYLVFDVLYWNYDKVFVPLFMH